MIRVTLTGRPGGQHRTGMSEARRRILDEREDTSLSPPWGRLASRGPVPLGEGAATGRQRIDCGGAPSDLDGSSRRRVAGPHEPDGVGADEPRQPAPGRQRLLLQARSGASRPHRAGARPERDDGRELELYRSPAESARLLRVRADLRARPSLPRLRRRDPDRAERARAGVVRGPGARGHPHPQGRSRRPLGGDVHAGVLAEVPRRRQQGQPLRRDDALYAGTNVGGLAQFRASAAPLGLAQPTVDLVAQFCAPARSSSPDPRRSRS